MNTNTNRIVRTTGPKRIDYKTPALVTTTHHDTARTGLRTVRYELVEDDTTGYWSNSDHWSEPFTGPMLRKGDIIEKTVKGDGQTPNFQVIVPLHIVKAATR